MDALSHTIDRRRLLRLSAAGAVGLTAARLALPRIARADDTPTAAAPSRNISPAEALRRLEEGNARYVSGGSERPNQSEERRITVARGQSPFATILGCADSRVSPEIVFDQGLGDLFVLRVAGNVIDDAITGSIEFAAEEFDTALVVVLGHERCGAISATVNALRSGGPVPRHIDSLVEAIRPAATPLLESDGDVVDKVVRANALYQAEQLRNSGDVVTELMHAGKLMIVSARYDLDTGEVEFLS